MKRLNLIIYVFLMIVSISFNSFLNNPLSAEEDESVKLRQKIADLESRIQYLEALLKVYIQPENTQTNPSFGWQNTKNWRKLEMGMTETKVQSILGEPIKTIKGVRTLWYYPAIYRGYVSFDENGQLIGWMEP